MRPDNPKCETCVAFWRDDILKGIGACALEPKPLIRYSSDWCMKHETPEEWRAKRSVLNGLNLSVRKFDLESHTGGPYD